MTTFQVKTFYWLIAIIIVPTTVRSQAPGVFVPGAGPTPPITIKNGGAFPGGAPNLPTPIPSLWNYSVCAVGNPVPPITPNINQQLYQLSTSGTVTTANLESQSYWGIAYGAAPTPAGGIRQFSALQKRGDAILNVEGGDLILTAQTRHVHPLHGGWLRFSTTARIVYPDPPPSPLPALPEYRDYERMTITDSGSVGIGTSTPRYKLEVAADPPTGGVNPGTILALYDSSASYGGISFISEPGVDYNIGKKTIDNWHTFLQIRKQQGDPLVTIDQVGNVGIGNDGPASRLVVKGADNLSTSTALNVTNSSDASLLIVRDDGFVGIGTPAPHASDAFTVPYKLGVNGLIKAKEIHVSLNNWADYVFDKEYRLLSIDSLSAFITANKHLPGIPESEEVVANGILLGAMQEKMMVKLEELSLYIIALNKRISQLEADSTFLHEQAGNNGK